MIENLKRRVIAEQFKPTLLGIFLNPFYIARKGLYDGIKRASHQIKGHTLDVGCGTKPYEKLFSSSEYIGLDTHQSGHNHFNSKVDYYFDGKIFPFRNEEFDSVVVFQVIDDVFTPSLFLSEINRVLKPGGKLLLTVSFVWAEHEAPFDFCRYTSFGISHILSEAGFAKIELTKAGNNFGIIFQLINAYIYKVLSKNLITKAFALILAIPFTLLGLLTALILPGNNDFYLDNIVLAEKS